MTKPAEVYFVDVKFSKRRGWGATAGVKGGRVARLAHALERRKAILGFDPDAVVRIFRSNTEWVEVTDGRK